MNLEFKLYEVNEESKSFNMIKNIMPNIKNDFIIVGEDENYFKLINVGSEKIKLTKGLNIEEIAYLFNKSDVKLQGNNLYTDTIELDIPQEYLSMEIIENIKKLNKI